MRDEAGGEVEAEGFGAVEAGPEGGDERAGESLCVAENLIDTVEFEALVAMLVNVGPDRGAIESASSAVAGHFIE